MKVTCTNPDHKDSRPSMELYESGGFCFSCGWFDSGVEGRPTKKVAEDIVSSIAYIKSLPLQPQRGLELHTNSTGFYILYPNGSYYKKRMFTGSNRYISPKGVSSPLYMVCKSSKKLIIFEGELNLLSFQKAYPNHTASLCSPGSAGNICKFLNIYLQFPQIRCIVDYDRAGVLAGVALKNQLKQQGRQMELIALDQDLNDILQTRGTDGIKAENLGM